MTISVFDLFTIGIGPSSSHTVGPMRAANQFVVALRRRGHLDDLEAMRVDLFGSLAATGAGRGTMSAILLGLEGCQPETITTEHKERRLAEIAASGVTRIGGVIPVPLTERDIDLHPDIVLPTHPNGMTFTAAAHTAASWPPRLIFRWAEGSSSRNRPAATAANIHAQIPFPTCRPKTAGHL